MLVDKYHPYGKTSEELTAGNYSIKYDLSRCRTDAQRRILAWPEPPLAIPTSGNCALGPENNSLITIDIPYRTYFWGPGETPGGETIGIARAGPSSGPSTG